MKKIIALILVICTLCVTLCSCDMLAQYIPGFKKDPEPHTPEEPVIDATVTEEEWNSAFELGNNVTITAETLSSAKMAAPAMKYESEYVSRSTNFSKYTEAAWYSKTTSYNKRVENGDVTEDSSESDSYEALNNDGEWYRIYKNSDGEWVADENYKNDIMIFYQIETIIGGKINFNDFTFDSDKKAYTRSFDASRLGGTVPFKEGTVAIYFKDGAIVKLEITMSGSSSQDMEVETGETTTVTIEGQTLITISFTDYGTTSVDVPKYTILEY